MDPQKESHRREQENGQPYIHPQAISLKFEFTALFEFML
jgi:hypothetical protein